MKISLKKKRRYMRHIHKYRYNENTFFHFIYWCEKLVVLIILIISLYIMFKAYMNNLWNSFIIPSVIFICLSAKAVIYAIGYLETTKDYHQRKQEIVEEIEDSISYSYKDTKEDKRRVITITVLYKELNKIEYNKYTGIFTIYDGLMQTIRMDGHITRYEKVKSLTMINYFEKDLIDIFDRRGLLIVEENKKTFK